VCTINAWIVYKHNPGFKMSLSEELSFSLMRAGKNFGTTLPTKGTTLPSKMIALRKVQSFAKSAMFVFV